MSVEELDMCLSKLVKSKFQLAKKLKRNRNTLMYFGTFVSPQKGNMVRRAIRVMVRVIKNLDMLQIHTLTNESQLTDVTFFSPFNSAIDARHMGYPEEYCEVIKFINDQAKMIALYRFTGRALPNLELRSLLQADDQDDTLEESVIVSNPQLQMYDLVFVPYEPLPADIQNYKLRTSGEELYRLVAVSRDGQLRVKQERQLGYPAYRLSEIPDAIMFMSEALKLKAFKVERESEQFKEDDRSLFIDLSDVGEEDDNFTLPQSLIEYNEVSTDVA